MSKRQNYQPNAKVEGANVPVQAQTIRRSQAEPEQTEPVETPEQRLARANKHAQAIFNGQSCSLGLAERVGRIRAALKQHGLGDLVERITLDESQNPSQSVPSNRTYKEFL